MANQPVNKLNQCQDNLYSCKLELLRLSKKEKLNYVDKLTISYPLMDQIICKIDECRESIQYCSQPECMIISGPPRAGKTTIIKEYMQEHPEINLNEGTVKPVVYCLVPCPATIDGLVSSLIQALGDPFYNKSSRISEKTFRLENLLKACKVELIILDEVQHLVDSNRKKVIMDSADWFKNLIAKTGISVVFVGLPECKKIFVENTQLGSRVLNRYEIIPFNYKDKSFRVILHLLDEALPFEFASDLSESGMWECIYIATHGILGYLKILIRESVNVAIENNYNNITTPILAQAYNNKLHQVLGPNPFVPGFDFDSYFNK